MKWAVMFGFLLIVFGVGLAALLYAVVLLLWEWRRRRTMRRRIRALGL